MTGDQAPPEVVDQAHADGEFVVMVNGAGVGVGRFELPAGLHDPLDPAERPRPEHLAVCRPCDVGPIPFRDDRARDRWAAIHAAATGHRVTLVHDGGSGSTIVGYADPPTRVEPADPVPLVGVEQPPVDDAPPAVGRVPAGERRTPLVEFVAHADRVPDLTCTITPAAGAAWLLVAAHACLAGRGTPGISRPPRVLVTGRAVRTGPLGGWSVTFDGVFGTPDQRFGTLIGAGMSVDWPASPEAVEQGAAEWVADHLDVDPARFAVVLLADELPDAEATQQLA